MNINQGDKTMDIHYSLYAETSDYPRMSFTESAAEFGAIILHARGVRRKLRGREYSLSIYRHDAAGGRHEMSFV